MSKSEEHDSGRRPPLVARCACGRGYNLAAWGRLPLRGTMDDGEGGTLELRHCVCGSHFSRLLP